MSASARKRALTSVLPRREGERHTEEVMSEHVRLTIELDPDGDPISGRLWAENLAERWFSGYVELMAALVSARMVARGDGDERSA
jgi:hypothetical protein